MSETEPIRSVKLFVANPEGEALVLVRNMFCKHNPGKMDLPGGKQEMVVDGHTKTLRAETVEETALRELYEETGIFEYQVALGAVAYVWTGRCDDGVYRERHYMVAHTSAEPVSFDDHASALWVPPQLLPRELPDKADVLAADHVLLFEMLQPTA